MKKTLIAVLLLLCGLSTSACLEKRDVDEFQLTYNEITKMLTIWYYAERHQDACGENFAENISQFKPQLFHNDKTISNLITQTKCELHDNGMASCSLHLKDDLPLFAGSQKKDYTFFLKGDFTCNGKSEDIVTPTLNFKTATTDSLFVIDPALYNRVTFNTIRFLPPEDDPDGDGISNTDPAHPDNCLDIANPNQLDSDSDGVGDACEVRPNQNDEGNRCPDPNKTIVGGPGAGLEGCADLDKSNDGSVSEGGGFCSLKPHSTTHTQSLWLGFALMAGLFWKKKAI